MSEHGYGLISEVDAQVIEKTLYLIIKEFDGHIINTLEIGVFNGDTSRGIHRFFTGKNILNTHKAIDSQKDFVMDSPFPECKFIIGNSAEVYNQIEDESQHFIFFDGCHAFPAVVCDFFCYASKVKPGGYMAFHDTGKHIKPFKDYQFIGRKDDPDMYISVRKALQKMELLNNRFPFWKLIFDEADENNEAGGIVVLQKIKK
jgi:hypothetical protein